MATFWIDSEQGDDSYDGTLAVWPGSGTSGPKLTASAGLALINNTIGNTLNFISRATAYVCMNSTGLLNNCTGTSYSNFGCYIRGTDVAGIPAMTKITFGEPLNASFFARFDGTSRYCIVEGFDFDRTIAPYTNDDMQAITITSISTGPIRIQYCINRCNLTGTRDGVFTQVSAANTNEVLEIRYCVFFSMGINSSVGLAPRGKGTVTRCIFFPGNSDIAPGTITPMPATSYHEITYNTFIFNTASTVPRVAGCGTSAVAGATRIVHSNVRMRTVPHGVNEQFLLGATAWEGIAFTGTKTIGHNVFIDPIGGSTWYSYGPYQVPWDPDNSDASGEPQFYSTDVVSAIDPFYNSSTPWTWANINGSGYSIDLPGDYRLILHRTAGLGGTVPGAIIESPNILPIATDDSYAINNDAVFTQSAPGVLANDTDPDSWPTSLTASIVTGLSPAAAGSVVLSSDGSFVFTPNSAYSGYATFTYRAYDGDGYSNTATVTLFISTPPAHILGSSVISVTTPGKIFPTAHFAAHINEYFNFDVDYDLDSYISISAAFPATAVVPASTTDATLSVGALSSFSALMISTDAPISLRVNNGAQVPLLKNGCMMICNAGSLTNLKVSNSSTMRAANLVLMAVN